MNTNKDNNNKLKKEQNKNKINNFESVIDIYDQSIIIVKQEKNKKTNDNYSCWR
jgi:hypothetical protein